MKVLPSIVLPLLLLLSACQSPAPEYRARVNEDYDVSDFKRYTWAVDHPLSVLGVLHGGDNLNLETRIKAYVGKSLQEKGYQFVNADNNPEFIVSFVAGIGDQESTSFHAVQSGSVYEEREVSWTQANDSTRGGVSVVIKIPDQIKPVWQGTAIQTLSNRDLRNQGGQALHKLIKQVMGNFPRSR